MIKQTAADLLQAALDAEDEKDVQKKAELFCKVHRSFPETPEAEQGLWRCALLEKELANAGEVEWEKVRDLFREYITYYPDGKKRARAYFEVGLAFDAMGFQREALSYFKLCVKRFPQEDVASEAQLRQARILLRIGRQTKAQNLYEELSRSEKRVVRLRARVGIADILNSRKEYEGTLKIFHSLQAKDPNFFRDDVDSLRVFGIAHLASGKVERGRDQLMHYLSLTGPVEDRADVLFRIGESYWHEKKIQAAQKLYKRVLTETGLSSMTKRVQTLSRMRLAAYLDDPDLPHGRWDKVRDLKDAAGDEEYLVVLDSYFEDPLAQDARLGLFWRFQARDDLENMLNYGKAYLRQAGLNNGAHEKSQLGRVFGSLASTLIANKRYKELYNLYLSEYAKVKNYPDGRLLYMVGQAVEALGLYEQASVLYWRALKWPLSNEEKDDLYLRRARVYLIQKDYTSAERLLKYLRKIYAGHINYPEIVFLSGKLHEAQKQPRVALQMYREALQLFPATAINDERVRAFVRLSLEVEGEKGFAAIKTLAQEGALGGAVLQDAYLKVADLFVEQGLVQKALSLYSEALAESLPQKGKIAQTLRLHYGDALLQQGRKEEATPLFKKAVTGEDPLLQQLARQRMNQNAIEAELEKLK